MQDDHGERTDVGRRVQDGMGVQRPNRKCPCLFAGMVLRSTVERTPTARRFVQVQRNGNSAVWRSHRGSPTFVPASLVAMWGNSIS